MNNADSVFRDGWQEMSREEALIKVLIGAILLYI
jgi:hypothetical protein